MWLLYFQLNHSNDCKRVIFGCATIAFSGATLSKEPIDELRLEDFVKNWPVIDLFHRLQWKREGTRWRTCKVKWRGKWRMQWVASTLHTTSEHAVSSITTAYAHTTAASSRLNWSPHRFKWTRPFHRKTKSGFSSCAITFQLASTYFTESFTILRRRK
jgi:hypothetical protein